MKQIFFTILIVMIGLLISSSAMAQSPLPGDAPAKMVHLRAVKNSLEKKMSQDSAALADQLQKMPQMIHLKALKHKMEQDSAMFTQQIAALQNEINSLKAGKTSPTLTPGGASTVVTLNMDSLAYAKLFDSLKKFGDKRWMNMYGKNTKLANLIYQIDSLWNYVSSLEDDLDKSRGYATSTQIQNVNRLNKLENVVAGFDTLLASARSEMKNLAGQQAQVENVLIGDYDRDLTDSQKADLEAIKARVAARKGVSGTCNQGHN